MRVGIRAAVSLAVALLVPYRPRPEVDVVTPLIRIVLSRWFWRFSPEYAAGYAMFFAWWLVSAGLVFLVLTVWARFRRRRSV